MTVPSEACEHNCASVRALVACPIKALRASSSTATTTLSRPVGRRFMTGRSGPRCLVAKKSPSYPVVRGMADRSQRCGYQLRHTGDDAENLALGFSRPASEGVHVGLLHCNVAGVAPEYTNYSPCTVDQLRETRLDYLALGHIHQRQIVATGSGPGDPWIVYPGNSQSRSPKSSEQEPKGATVVRAEMMA